jgi:S-formylglutathione hydrolase FrmB
LNGESDIPEVPLIAGDVDAAANDVYALAARNPPNLRPHLYFDCGRDDFLFAENEDFARYLRAQEIEHTYHRFDGVHDWAYWDMHIQDALKFHMRVMELSAH